MTLSENLRKLHKNPLYRFAFNFVLFSFITITFHYLWWNFLGFFRATDLYLTISGALAENVFRVSSWINLNLLGLNMYTEDATNTLRFPGIGYITVVEACSGFKQFYQIFFLFVLFPGPWQHKLWYIPLCIAIMYVVNFMRIVILSLVLIHATPHWDFAHMWILRPFFYVVIFIQWIVWVEYFLNQNKKQPIQLTA